MRTRISYVIFILMFAVIFSACEFTPDQDELQYEQTEELISEANRQVGFPNIVNFQEKKVFKEILELRDQENLITYCYLFNEMTGEVGQFLGRGIGYGVPAATQFTNPMREERAYQGSVTLPQPDPNGLFMPTATSATWYMLLDSNNEARAVYIEPLIIVSPFPLK